MGTKLTAAAPWSRARGSAALLLLALLLLAVFVPASVAADTLDDQVRAIAKELRCPVCTGETVADSNAQISVQMRGIIRQKLEAGETPDQIKAYFVARYGESILAAPPTKGFTLGVWIAPIVALLLGVAIVGAVLRSWLRRGPGAAVAPTALLRAAVPAEDDDRIERELARFRQEQARKGRVAR